MTTRIIPQLVSLSLIACAAHAADVAPVPVVEIDPVAVEVTTAEPVLIVCPGVDAVDEVVTKPEIEEPEVVTCEGIEGEVVECEVVEVRHYSGSEVERGGDVDPVILYSTGVMTLGGGAAGLEQGISGSGIAAVSALKVDLPELASPARELKVLDNAGDIIISD